MAYPELDTRPWNLGLPLLVLATACGPKVEIGEESSTDTIDPTHDPSDPTHDPTDPTSDPTSATTGPNGCVYDADCGYGYICVDGECIYDGYCNDGGCCYDEGGCCYDGCWYECYSDQECGPGEVCEWGYCQPAEVGACPTTPEYIPIPLPQGSDGSAMTLAFVQTDGDFARELVIGTPAGAQLIDAGNSPVALPVMGAVLEAVAADLDGDGDEDLALSITDDQGGYWIETLAQDGAGGFVPLQTMSGVYLGLSAGDVTGDGLADVAATTPAANGYAVVVLASDGMQLAAPMVIGANGYDAPLTAMSSANIDPYLDLAAHMTGELHYWQGGPALDPQLEAALADVETPMGLHGGDLDGDGVGDLATVVNASEWSAIMLWRGDEFGPQSLSSATIPLYPWSSTTGDVDSDASPELVIGSGGMLGIVRSSFGEIECWSMVEAPHDVARLAVGDYDGDGVGDIAISDGNTTTVMVRLP